MLNNRCNFWSPLKSASWLIACAGVVFFFISVTVNAAQGEDLLNGFLSARFGMSADEVLVALKADGVQIGSDKTKNGARQIRGKRKGKLTTNKLIYVIPEDSNKLALAIEFYDSPDFHEQVLADLREQLGEELGSGIADMTLAQAEGQFPAGIKELTLWAITAGDSNLLVRLMRFDDYLAVERLDAKLMSK